MRFVHIYTFFCNKIMCGYQLAICLYGTRRAGCERILHHSHCHAVCADLSRVCVHHRQDIPTANSSHHACPEPRCAAAIICRHILLGENSFDLIRTRAHEKNPVDFFRAEPLYVLYIAGKNVKNCKVTYARGFFASIYCFIWLKYSWKNMAIGSRWQSS